MTELELKARAYELVLIIENCKMELVRINEQLAKIAQDKTSEPTEEG